MPGIFLTTNVFAHVGGFFLRLFLGFALVKGSSGDGTMKFDYGFCFALWVISGFAGVAHLVGYIVHSRRSRLAKSDLTAYCCAKASSTMPGIFLTANEFALIGSFFCSNYGQSRALQQQRQRSHTAVCSLAGALQNTTLLRNLSKKE